MAKFKIGDKVYSQSDPFHVHTHLGVAEVVGISGSGAWKMYHTLSEGEDPQEARYGCRAANLVHANLVEKEQSA